MKLNKKSLLTIALITASTAFAANANVTSAGDGVINFLGKVIDAPCGIATESSNQTIDFNQISKSHLEKDGISMVKKIPIKLINCDLTKVGPESEQKYKGVKLTFTGNTVKNTTNELATAGGTGTAIVISPSTGELVNFNEAGALQSIGGDSNTLVYTSWVKKGTGLTVSEGEFTATTNFTLAYE